MDENRKKLAKKYERIKLYVGISESVITLILLLLVVILGLSSRLESIVYGYTSNSYLALILFTLVLGLCFQIISFPAEYYFGFKLEHKFDLSNQSLGKWLIENLKSLLLGLVLGLPILLLFYWFLKNFEFWWIWSACVMLLYSVILAQIAPIVIFPLFYKFVPIENESIRQRILNLCDNVGFKVKGVFSFDMSKTTKKANAAFTGIGRTKRIILGDTLLSNFSEDEIETVFAHELGHYSLGHIKKTILISTLSVFVGLYIVSALYQFTLHMFGYTSVYQLGALPLLAVISSLLGIISRPLTSLISRKFEFEADKYAIETTKNLMAFESTMEKLAFQNLTDEEPNKFVEFWFHSHPSVRRRIEHAGKVYSALYITTQGL